MNINLPKSVLRWFFLSVTSSVGFVGFSIQVRPGWLGLPHEAVILVDAAHVRASNKARASPAAAGSPVYPLLCQAGLSRAEGELSARLASEAFQKPGLAHG